MLITNKSRKNQHDLFVDEDHKVMDEYYAILEEDISPGQLKKKMLSLIQKDKDFYDPYIDVASVLFYEGKQAEGLGLLRKAYEGAVSKIVDSQGRWPKQLLWGFFENRHLMRAIEEYARACWNNGQIEEALDIFRRLLKANHNDNQGIRYYVLAIKMGLNSDEWQEPFMAKRNGESVGLDAFKVNDWFRENAKKYPDEFQWLLEIYEKE